MKLKKKEFYKNALFIAVNNENTEIVKLLLKNDKINPNLLNVLNFNI